MEKYWKAIGSALGALVGALPTLAGYVPEPWGAIVTAVGAIFGTYWAPKNED